LLFLAFNTQKSVILTKFSNPDIRRLGDCQSRILEDPGIQDCNASKSVCYVVTGILPNSIGMMQMGLLQTCPAISVNHLDITRWFKTI